MPLEVLKGTTQFCVICFDSRSRPAIQYAWITDLMMGYKFIATTNECTHFYTFLRIELVTYLYAQQSKLHWLANECSHGPLLTESSHEFSKNSCTTILSQNPRIKQILFYLLREREMDFFFARSNGERELWHMSIPLIHRFHPT